MGGEQNMDKNWFSSKAHFSSNNQTLMNGLRNHHRNAPIYQEQWNNKALILYVFQRCSLKFAHTMFITYGKNKCLASPNL